MALPQRVKADVDLQLSPRSAAVVALTQAVESVTFNEFEEMNSGQITDALITRAEKFNKFLTEVTTNESGSDNAEG